MPRISSFLLTCLVVSSVLALDAVDHSQVSTRESTSTTLSLYVSSHRRNGSSTTSHNFVIGILKLKRHSKTKYVIKQSTKKSIQKRDTISNQPPPPFFTDKTLKHPLKSTTLFKKLFWMESDVVLKTARKSWSLPQGLQVWGILQGICVFCYSPNTFCYRQVCSPTYAIISENMLIFLTLSFNRAKYTLKQNFEILSLWSQDLIF